MTRRFPSRRGWATGDYPQALREWADWIYIQGELAANAAGPKARDPDGEPVTWKTYCGMRELALIEAAIAAGLWAPSSTSQKAAE
jgi:hypothetical protein